MSIAPTDLPKGANIVPTFDQDRTLHQEPADLERRRPVTVGLDLLRGLAALLVLFVHVRGGTFVEFGALPADQKTWLVAALFAITRMGQEAVLVFFVLSGFLVGGQIIERAKRGTFSLSEYAIDRCTRIFLPLIPACLMTAVIGALVYEEPTQFLQVLANMTGLNDIVAPTLHLNAPLWSLSFEIWFYIVGGALGYIVTKKADTATLALALALAVLAVCVPIFATHGTEYLMYWGFGAFMIEYRKVPITSSLFFTGVALLLTGAILHELTFASKSFENVAFIPIRFSRSMLCVGTCLMLPLLCDHRTDSVLQIIRKPSAALSAFSYTLYLFHYPVNSVLDLIFPKFGAISLEAIGVFSARILICVSFSIGFYFCFERNTAFLRRHIRQRLYDRSPGHFFSRSRA